MPKKYKKNNSFEGVSQKQKIKMVLKSVKELVAKGLCLATCKNCQCPIDNLEEMKCFKCGPILIENLLFKSVDQISNLN